MYCIIAEIRVLQLCRPSVYLNVNGCCKINKNSTRFVPGPAMASLFILISIRKKPVQSFSQMNLLLPTHRIYFVICCLFMRMTRGQSPFNNLLRKFIVQRIFTSQFLVVAGPLYGGNYKPLDICLGLLFYRLLIQKWDNVFRRALVKGNLIGNRIFYELLSETDAIKAHTVAAFIKSL